MEVNSNVFRHWDDVVFENRNKSYGVYLLRRAYEKRLLMGEGITVALVALLFLLQNIYSGKEIIHEAFPPLVGEDIRVLPPPIIKRVPPQHTIRQPKANPQTRAVLVTRDEVIEDEEVEAITDFISSGDDLGSGDVAPIAGSGTIPLLEPTPIVEPGVLDFAEVQPQYEGGLKAMMKFIQKKIRYPRVPRQLGIDGTVFVRFVVKGDGSITDVQVLKGVHPDYDKEAIRVISMLPSWNGGSHNGRPVSVRMVLPIKFNLQK
ncbi:MAG: energy transducer TonB [Cyclobacteriaceae bacterium]